MKISTILLVGLLCVFSSALLAKPSISTFSTPPEGIEADSSHSTQRSVVIPYPIDTAAVCEATSLSPTFFIINDLCGQGTGSIDLTPDPNTQGPWLYMWSNGETTQDISGLTPGAYTVTIFDANGVLQIRQAVVQSLPPISPLSATAVITPNTVCNGNGNGNGAIDLTVTPNPAVFTYEWSNGETTMDMTNLDPGTYTVSVTYGVTCITPYTFVVPNNTNAPTVVPPIQGWGYDFCDQGNGWAVVGVVGGVPPYTYEWSNGGTTMMINDLTPGTYFVTVTGANGCTVTHSETVQAADLAVNVSENQINPNTTCNGANGSVSITLTPVGSWTSTATFLWSNGATTQNLTNVPSGSYRVTVTRAGTCTATEVFYVENEPVFPALTFANTASSCGFPNGAINLSTLPGGVPPYGYLWSNGATTQDISNLLPGMYEVTLSSGNGCTTTASTTVEDVPVAFGITGNVTNHNGCDTTNGRIVLSITPSNLAVLWSTGSTATTLNFLPPGNYSVTVSAGGTCTRTESFDIADLTEYPVTPVIVDTATCGLNNGGIDLSVTLGTSPFKYLWSTGATTQDVSGLGAGTYSVTVTTAVGCSSTRTVTVRDTTTIPVVSGVAADNNSCVLPNGTIAVNALPLDTLYTYIWSNGDSIPNLSGLAGGIYTVTVSLGGNCTTPATFAVANVAAPPGLAASNLPATCGLANGAANLDISTGAPPYTFLWSNTQTTEDISNLLPGVYAVTATGANGCTAAASVTVPDNGIALNLGSNTVGNASCTASNGSIDLTVSPAGAYTYAWSNTAVTEDLFGLAAGSYTVTVSIGNCMSTGSFTVADNTATPNIGTNITAAVCGVANGAIDLTASGSAAPYTFFWSNAQTTEDLANLLPGNYSVTVTAQNGCTSTATFNVPNNASNFSLAAVPADLTNCTSNNGAINLTVTPAAAYTVVWSTGATTEDLGNLAAGTYTVSVTQSGSCTATATYFVVDQRVDPATTQSVVAELCGLGDGSIDLSISGGTAPYGYQWGTGQISQDLVGINAGAYVVTVTDANGCTAIANATVPNSSISFSLAGTPLDNSSCIQNNGSIDLNLNPTVPPAGNGYTYLWSNAANTQDLNMLNAGSYTVTVSAGGTCTATATFAILSNVPMPLLSQSITAGFCGQASGGIDLTVTGSPAPYQYFWSNASTNEDLTTLLSGTYTVTVTAANGCTSTSNITVPENSVTPAIGGLPTSATSCVANNGAIDLTVGPALPYQFLWSNGATTEDLANLATGMYTVTVDGGGACTSTANFTVGSNSPVPVLSQSIIAGFCGQAIGSIDLTVSGSSPGPYQYFWSNAATSEDLNTLLSGAYTVTVTASNGCSTTSSITVPENSITPMVNGQLTPATSCIISNGAIDLTVGPAIPFTFMWSNGATTEDLSNIASGNYTVTVDGGGACTSTAAFTVNSNTGMVTLGGLAAPVLCFGGTTGSIDLNVSTGTGPYIYAWSPNIAGGPQDPTNLQAGTYTVTVTDANGCTATSSFAVAQPAAALQVQCSVTDLVSQIGLTDGAAAVNIAGGTGPYTVNWSPGSSQSAVPAGNFPITSLGANAYGVTVTDANGCPTTCGFTVSVASCATAVGTMGSTPLAQCGNGCITATYNTNGQFLAPGDQLQFVLHTGSGAQITGEIARSAQPNFCFNAATMTFGTTYYISAVVGAVANGNVDLAAPCTVVSSGNPVVFNEKPVASANAPAPIDCATAQVPLEGASNLANSTYLWSTALGSIVGSPAQAMATAGAAGTYNLVVTNSGCKDTVVVTVANISNNPQAAISGAAGILLDCATQSISLTGQANGTANGVLSWSSNGVFISIGNTLAVTTSGNYELTVLDTVTSCSSTSTVAITQNLTPPTVAIAPPALLTCASPSQALTATSPVAGTQFVWANILGSDTTLLGGGPALQVNTIGTYFLFGTNPANHCSGATSVAVAADQVPPIAEAGATFEVDCAGGSASLDGSGSTGAANLGYAWSTQNGHLVSGIQTVTPTIDVPGTYSLVVTNLANGCTDTDEVIITGELPQAFAVVDQPDCFGQKGAILIDSVKGLAAPITYTLNNGQPGTSNLFFDLDPGTYDIKMEDGNGCATALQLTLNAAEEVIIGLTPTAEIGLGHDYHIDAHVNLSAGDIASIAWYPSVGLSCDTCLDPVANALFSTTYELTVTAENGCSASALLALQVNQPGIYVPNIFTPDIDGFNNRVTVFADLKGILKIKAFEIYTRWGGQVFGEYDFLANDPGYGWDGWYNGQRLNPGVYVWHLVAEFADGHEEVLNGDVTLVR